MFVSAALTLLALTVSAQDFPPPAPMAPAASPPAYCTHKDYDVSKAFDVHLSNKQGPFFVSPNLPLYIQAVSSSNCSSKYATMSGLSVTACADSSTPPKVKFLKLFGKVFFSVTKPLGVPSSVTVYVYCIGAGAQMSLTSPNTSDESS